MRWMILVIPKGYESAEPDTTPDPAQLKAMQAYNKELFDAGILRAMDGLDAPAAGARVTFDTGKPVVKDGPFAEAKEVLGGYWLIEVGSKEEAVGWAKRAPMSPNEILEVRKVHDYKDWPAEMRGDVDQFLDLRDRVETKR